MGTLTTKRGKQVQLKSIGEWMEWAYKAYGKDAGLVGIEQAYFQSMKYKVCVECLSQDNLVLQTNRALIKSTDYYLCQECIDYYANKE